MVHLKAPIFFYRPKPTIILASRITTILIITTFQYFYFHNIASQKDALMHNTAKFQALRGQEKRLMAKIAEEEKTKKKFEERNLRAKLVVQVSRFIVYGYITIYLYHRYLSLC